MSDYIFNVNDWETTVLTDAMLQEIREELDQDFVNVIGDTMEALNCTTVNANTGIYTPALDIGTEITFPDGTTQNTAYSSNALAIIEETVTALNTKFNNTIIDMSYNPVLLKTIIGNNCLINNLTCNNINTNHLNDTSGNLQIQINLLKSTFENITSSDYPTINDNLSVLNDKTINIDVSGNMAMNAIEFTDKINNISAQQFSKISEIQNLIDRTTNIESTGTLTSTKELQSTTFLCTGVCSIDNILNANGNVNFAHNLNIHGDVTFNYGDINTGIDYSTTLTGFDFGYLKTAPAIDTTLSNNINNLKADLSGNVYNYALNENLDNLKADLSGNVYNYALDSELDNLKADLSGNVYNYALDSDFETYKNNNDTNITNITNKLTNISFDGSGQTTVNDVLLSSNLLLANTVADNTIEKFSQPDYEDKNFYALATLKGGTNFVRPYYLGILNNETDNLNHFAVGVPAGGGDDPNIIMSLSISSAYFFGVKQPLVPVGAVQIYAGLSNNIPNGYLLCNGALVSKTTYNLLWNVIGNQYLNGRTANSTNFYLPDLRGLFVRGVGTNTTYEGVEGATISGASSTGAFQTSSVEQHFHEYNRVDDAISVTSGGGVNNSSVWDNSTRAVATSRETYIGTGTLMTNETRPYNISMNYIIKF